MTGDIITSTTSAAEKAKKAIPKQLNKTDESLEDLLGISAKVPQPVFFCSIEPPSLASQTALEQALTELEREDPSFHVTNDPETAQTVLAGMGELHLEIIKDRILKEYKIDAELGPLQIAYRECPVKQVTSSLTHETKVGTSKQLATVRLSLIPTNEEPKDILKLDRTQEAASSLANILPKHLKAVRQGIEFGLSHGPKIHSQVSCSRKYLYKKDIRII